MTVSMTPCLLLLVLSVTLCQLGVSFAPQLTRPAFKSSVLFASMDDDNDKDESSIPKQLPGSPPPPPQNDEFFATESPVGGTRQPSGSKQPPSEPTKKTPIGYVGSPTLQLQYTCKVCDTRNCHEISRAAYREGIVIATCKGCDSKHLIADHLGSSASSLTGTIEDYMNERGDGDAVRRVTREVFDLEKILGFDSKGGSLVGDDGEAVLE